MSPLRAAQHRQSVCVCLRPQPNRPWPSGWAPPSRVWCWQTLFFLWARTPETRTSPSTAGGWSEVHVYKNILNIFIYDVLWSLHICILMFCQHIAMTILWNIVIHFFLLLHHMKLVWSATITNHFYSYWQITYISMLANANRLERGPPSDHVCGWPTWKLWTYFVTWWERDQLGVMELQVFVLCR